MPSNRRSKNRPEWACTIQNKLYLISSEIAGLVLSLAVAKYRAEEFENQPGTGISREEVLRDYYAKEKEARERLPALRNIWYRSDQQFMARLKAAGLPGEDFQTWFGIGYVEGILEDWSLIHQPTSVHQEASPASRQPWTGSEHASKPAVSGPSRSKSILDADTAVTSGPNNATVRRNAQSNPDQARIEAAVSRPSGSKSTPEATATEPSRQKNDIVQGSAQGRADILSSVSLSNPLERQLTDQSNQTEPHLNESSADYSLGDSRALAEGIAACQKDIATLDQSATTIKPLLSALADRLQANTAELKELRKEVAFLSQGNQPGKPQASTGKRGIEGEGSGGPPSNRRKL